jgi:hypothetical protein
MTPARGLRPGQDFGASAALRAACDGVNSTGSGFFFTTASRKVKVCLASRYDRSVAPAGETPTGSGCPGSPDASGEPETCWTSTTRPSVT